MNIIVLLMRLMAGLFFLILTAMSADPTLPKTNPAWHANIVAFIVSLALACLHLLPLLPVARNKNVVYALPKTTSFTGTRLLTFSRRSLAFLLGGVTVAYLFEFKYACGILSFIIVCCMIPPMDKLMFAPARAFEKQPNTRLNFLKVLPILAVTGGYIAIGFADDNTHPYLLNILIVSAGLLPILPIVLVAKNGWKFRNLKPFFLPVQSSPGQTSTSQPPAKRKYYSAKAWYWNYPVPKEYRNHPISEEGFDMLMKGFERSWLEAKDYHRRMIRHPDPALYTRGLIAEAEAYIQSMHKRFELKTFNKLFTKGYLKEQFIPDEVARIWSADRKLRSLYRALKRFCETPNKMNFNSFSTMAPHIAEYRAMINLVKHLKHALYRMPGQKPPESPAKRSTHTSASTPTPVPTPAPNPASTPTSSPAPISSPAPLAVAAIISSLISRPATASVPEPESTSGPMPIPEPTNDIVPIVFLSYSWDSQEHENWVVRLATLLCENGVNAILDKWDLGPLGKPLPHFMETSITRSQRVICVMTPNYKRKTENLTGGVGYEYSIISAEIFGNSTNTSKFIPLFRNGTDADAIPAALRGRKYVDMRDDLHFEEKFVHELLRDIYDEPKFKKPAIGKKPKF